MTGVVEGGALVTFLTTAASTVGMAAYANVKTKGCFAGFFTKNTKKDGDWFKKSELLQGPLSMDAVKVRLGNAPAVSRGVQFNGEVLFLSSSESARGTMSPTVALGACNVSIKDAKIVVSPPSIPDIELTFANATEAQRWQKEFNEAVLVGPPQERIQELVDHTLRVEKHVADLRARSQKVFELEQHSKKLQKNLTLHKAGVSDEPRKSQAGGVLTAWFGSNAEAMNSEEKAKMMKELSERDAELKKAQGQNSKLKESIVESARSNGEVSLKWRSLVNQKIQRVKEGMAQDLARSQDLGIPQTPDYSRQRSAEAPLEEELRLYHLTPGEWRPDTNKEFEQRVKDVENQLAASRQSFQENLNANSGIRMQSALLPEKAASQESSNAGPRPFRTLEERILSHQSQVYQDCDVLQEAFKSQFV